MKRTKELYDELRKKGNLIWLKNIQKWEQKIPEMVASWAKAQISPICSFLGGIVSQEIIKYTGLYIPINQWLIFDFFETVENLGKNVDRQLKNSRYDDQIAIFGNEIQKKIEETNIFLIGAGALGCEYLKNFALMGISTSKGKEIIVTDNDNIKLCNLNNQFLFSKKDIGKSKSKCASLAVKKINPLFNIKDLQYIVSKENENIFTEQFFDSKTFVINAVDNIQARRYIDNKCTLYGKCLIDSGISGTKAHLQMIVPNITSCYNDSSDPPNNYDYYNGCFCIIEKFSFVIEHCIRWAFQKFEEYFTDVINDIKKFFRR